MLYFGCLTSLTIDSTCERSETHETTAAFSVRVTKAKLTSFYKGVGNVDGTTSVKKKMHIGIDLSGAP